MNPKQIPSIPHPGGSLRRIRVSWLAALAVFAGTMTETRAAASQEAFGIGFSALWEDLPVTGLVTSTNLPIDPASLPAFFRLRAP